MQEEPSNISPIKAVHDLARRNKVRIFIRKMISFLNDLNKIFAEYRIEKESGPAHAKLYTIRLFLGEKQYIGVERSIKLAQRAAAQIALDDHKHLSSINNPDQKLNSIFILVFLFLC
jgi:dsRNA-specific ribonuclease